MVTRLVENKGLDLVLRILEELLQNQVQFVVLGTGDAKYEQALEDLARRYPDKMALAKGFNEGLAHRFYAGADIFVMPSRFEPCGLSQLIALKYGTVPVVRETGGLKDTVIPFNKSTGKGNGFRFDNFNAHELLFTLQKALGLYADQKIWEKLVHNAIVSRNGWNKSAGAYVDLYRKLIPGREHHGRRSKARK
jgi:starch synthase